MDEPTKGLDGFYKKKLAQILKGLTAEGKTILMVSSEMPELIGMSDRILVMRFGQVAGELKREEFSQELILEYASGLIGG